jgi:hypothetical protein
MISRKCYLALLNDHQVLPLPQLQKINLSGDPMDSRFAFDVYKISDLFEGGRITYTYDTQTVPGELIFC